jgi:hypothetical protein
MQLLRLFAVALLFPRPAINWPSSSGNVNYTNGQTDRISCPIIQLLSISPVCCYSRNHVVCLAVDGDVVACAHLVAVCALGHQVGLTHVAEGGAAVVAQAADPGTGRAKVVSVASGMKII